MVGFEWWGYGSRRQGCQSCHLLSQGSPKMVLKDGCIFHMSAAGGGAGTPGGGRRFGRGLSRRTGTARAFRAPFRVALDGGRDTPEGMHPDERLSVYQMRALPVKSAATESRRRGGLSWRWGGRGGAWRPTIPLSTSTLGLKPLPRHHPPSPTPP